MKGVKDHAVLTESGEGYLDRDTESLSNIAYATTGHPGELTEYHPKGMTIFEKTVLRQLLMRWG